MKFAEFNFLKRTKKSKNNFFLISDGSNDVDSNYDPSEFLIAAQNKVQIQDDLAVSESDEEESKCDVKPQVQQTAVAEEAPSDLWF